MEEIEIRRVFASNLQKIMDANRMTAKDVERRSGVTSRMIGYILKLERSPTIDVVTKLSSGLRVQVDSFFKTEDDKAISIADLEHLELLNQMTKEEREKLEHYAKFIIESRS